MGIATVTAVFILIAILTVVMNQTISLGHAPAVASGRTLRSRALRSVNVRKMCVRAVSLARRKSLTLAAISATLSVAGVAVASDPLTYSAALVALGAAYVATECQKGGEL